MAAKADEELSRSEEEICLSTGQSLHEVQSELLSKSKRLVARLEQRFDTICQPSIIHLAFEGVNKILNDGMTTGRGIIDICGEAGVGKTQLLLDMALSCVKVAYICTEGRFPERRLDQLIKSKRWPNARLENILISQAPDLPALMSIVTDVLPKLVKSSDLSLIIIDSITCPFRTETSSGDRTRNVLKIARQLHCLSIDNNIAVVCSNQVSDDMSGGVKACLGETWTMGISGRLFIRRVPGQEGVRRITIEKAEDYLKWKHVGSHLDFIIKQDGLHTYSA